MSDIGIVVVTYNSADHIGPCLDAALTTGAEIIVVDNTSSDETCERVRLRPVRLIANRENLGFAAAVNQGVAALSTPFILLLNPDARIRGGLEKLRAACELPHSAGAGGMLVDQRGRPQVGFMVRRFPTVLSLVLEVLLLNRICPGNAVNRRYRCLDLDYSRQLEVEQPAGAFLMFRRDVWQKLGGLDERFAPLWFEDVDFCCRTAKLGYRMFFVPEAVAEHTGGHSIPKISVEMRPLYWYRNLIEYSIKHFPPARAKLVALAVLAGAALRLPVEMLLGRSLKPVVAYGRVIQLAGRLLLQPAGRMQ